MALRQGLRGRPVAILAMASALVAGCAGPQTRLTAAHPATTCRDYLVGTWHYDMISDAAESYSPVAHRSSVTLAADGTYTLVHTVYPGGPVPATSEQTGRWTASAGEGLGRCVLTFDGMSGSPYAGAVEIVSGSEIRIGNLRAGRGS